MKHSATLTLAKTEFKRLCGKDAQFVLEPALPSFEISRVDGEWLFRAPNEVELLYAVYDCAERFSGYDFFEPGTEDFDPTEVKCVPDNGVLVPARPVTVRHCGFIQEFPFDETDTPKLFDFMAKNKLNYLLVWMKYYDELPEYLQINAELARKHGMESWTNCETFDRDMPIHFLPIKWEKMWNKLRAAERVGIEKAITFEFSHFMSPNSMYISAHHLYDRYCEYVASRQE